MSKMDFHELPSTEKLKVYVALLDQKKYIDFDFLSYNDVLNIQFISDLFDNIEFNEYLAHRLLVKCVDISIILEMNAKLRELLERQPLYLVKRN